MEATLIHFEPKQKRLLARLARRRGTSLAQEVREAVEMYLELSPGSKEELAALASAANQAADRMIRNLDETIAALQRAERRPRGKRR